MALNPSNSSHLEQLAVKGLNFGSLCQYRIQSNGTEQNRSAAIFIRISQLYMLLKLPRAGLLPPLVGVDAVDAGMMLSPSLLPSKRL